MLAKRARIPTDDDRGSAFYAPLMVTRGQKCFLGMRRIGIVLTPLCTVFTNGLGPVEIVHFLPRGLRRRVPRFK